MPEQTTMNFSDLVNPPPVLPAPAPRAEGEGCDQMLMRNPSILTEFIRRGLEALEATKRGARRKGAKGIAEDMREDARLRMLGEEWAINNNYVADLARLAMEREPRLRGYFETRRAKR